MELGEHPDKHVVSVSCFTERQVEQAEMIYQNAYHFL